MKIRIAKSADKIIGSLRVSPHVFDKVEQLAKKRGRVESRSYQGNIRSDHRPNRNMTNLEKLTKTVFIYDLKPNWDTIRVGQIGRGGQGDRIYSQEGKSVALSALGGGRGAKTGLYAVPVALRNRGVGKKPEYNGTDKANALTSVQTDSMVEQDTVIRKLTCIECERLQGMPDNWTNPTGDISNTQRYKMCGNAFNVDVVAHILSFIK